MNPIRRRPRIVILREQPVSFLSWVCLFVVALIVFAIISIASIPKVDPSFYVAPYESSQYIPTPTDRLRDEFARQRKEDERDLRYKLEAERQWQENVRESERRSEELKNRTR